MVSRGENLRQRLLLTLTLVFLLVMGVSVYSIYRADSLYATTGFLISVMVLLGGALFVFIYFLTGHVEKRLLATRDRLVQEIEERRQAQEELSEYRRQLEAKVAARTLDLQAINVHLQEEIAGREHAEHMVREALAEWERTFNAIGDIVTIHDREMRMVRVNRAAAETFGVEPQELIGRFCYQVFRGLSSPCPGCPEVNALRSFQRHHAEIEHHNLGKTFLVTASPIFDNQGGFTGMVHIAKDITIQKQLENRLRQTQRMEAVGTLASGIAHDFNNLLTGIIGYADLCLGEADSESQFRGDLAEILRLAGRGADLVRQLQAFSRQQVTKPAIIDLNELVANLLKMLQRLLGEDISLRFYPAALGQVEVDPGQMEQILINLAVNAREAMPDGGNLSIETSDEEMRTEAARQAGLAAGAYIRLLVRDSGRGMDEATLERIFDPFYTTKNAATGTGLGLAVIFGIIKQHRGLIQAESIPGQGTTFTIYLPRVFAGDQRPETAEPLPSLPARRTVLLVEDEPVLRNVIRRMLVKAGYLVLDTGNPAAAEKLFAEKRDEISLLLTDMIMPGSNGRDLYRKLAVQAPGLKVLFMSGHQENPLVKQGIMEGDLPFLAKPFSPECLEAKIKEILR